MVGIAAAGAEGEAIVGWWSMDCDCGYGVGCGVSITLSFNWKNDVLKWVYV